MSCSESSASPEQLASAKTAIYELLGRRNPLGPVQVIDRYPSAPTRNGVLTLAGRPVREIVRVTVGGRDTEDYVLHNGFMLQIGGSCCSGGCGDQRAFPYFFGPNGGSPGYTSQYGIGSSAGYPDTRYGICRCWVEVEYVYGTPPNDVVKCAINRLAEAICSTCGCVGDCECGTPDNVTSIQRQGISWQIEEVDVILESGGRTGVPEVDKLLAMFNPDKARRRAGVFTFSNPPARRLSAIRLADSWTPS
jgi:hypothetical protein